MRRWIGWALAAALVAPAVWSGELVGVTMPDEVTVSDATLHLNGMGVRKKLWIKVYVGGLYLVERTGSADAAMEASGPKRVVMHFLTNKATKGKMDSAWEEGFEGNSADQLGELQGRLETFKGFFGDMKVDDLVEIDMIPGEGTRVAINGREKGLIQGDDFAQALLRVWLGPAPPSEELKSGMLGQ